MNTCTFSCDGNSSDLPQDLVGRALFSGTRTLDQLMLRDGEAKNGGLPLLVLMSKVRHHLSVTQAKFYVTFLVFLAFFFFL